MSQASSVALAKRTEDSCAEGPANVSLKGTTRGLEILISGAPSAAALGARLTELLAEAPGFFAGSTARIAIDGALPVGALACLEDVATRFELRIVEIGPAARRGLVEAAVPGEITGGSPRGDARSVKLVGTGPVDEAAERCGDDPAGAALTAAPGDAAGKAASTAAGDAAGKAASRAAGDAAGKAASTAAPTEAAGKVGSAGTPGEAAGKAASSAAPGDPGLVAALAAVLAAAGGGPGAAAPAGEDPAGPRLVIGPVRSGRIVDHVGHLIVIGDVNPGAEIRAEGSIIVLGRLRGVAHAAIGRDAGCIIALSLQPQQLRIGRMVARAGDADRPSGGAEIAYATGETIVVERFLGRLPSGLAASM